MIIKTPTSADWWVRDKYILLKEHLFISFPCSFQRTLLTELEIPRAIPKIKILEIACLSSLRFSSTFRKSLVSSETALAHRLTSLTPLAISAQGSEIDSLNFLIDSTILRYNFRSATANKINVIRYSAQSSVMSISSD